MFYTSPAGLKHTVYIALLSEAGGICRSSLAPQKWREPWYSCSTKHSKAFDEPISSGLTAIAVRRYDVVEGRRSILLGDFGWD